MKKMLFLLIVFMLFVAGCSDADVASTNLKSLDELCFITG